jgi:nucleotide-binding universal stress UspA family protein
MFRDILVILGEKGAAASYVLSFAHLFDADVTAVWAKRGAAYDAVESAQTRYDMILGGQAEAEGAASRHLQDFAVHANSAAIRTHIIKAGDAGRPESSKLRQFARCFDLIVLEQPEPGQSAYAGGMIGSLLSGSGRPVLVAPYIQKDPASFERIVVAWDASASAARALGDALPILKRAGAVEIVTVANKNIDRDLPGGADVARHLARHGVDATFAETPGEIDAGNMLLSYIADSGAKLMVTGGYGHSRLSETVLGGVTRTLLESMTIPLFMSH